jgi:hypothetical protein
MASGAKNSRLNGWQVQADRLALKHTVIPALPQIPPTATTRRQPSRPTPQLASRVQDAERHSIERPAEVRPDHVASPSAQPFSREETLEWIQSTRKAVLELRAERVKAADERIAELEASLEAAMQRVISLQNENQSLEESLEARACENLDLTNRLIEAETTGQEVRSELESSEMTRAEYDLAIAAADRKIELLENLIEVKEARTQKLQQSREQAQQDVQKLLATAKTRDQSLADAERRIAALTGLFEKLQHSLEAGKTDAVSRQIKQVLGTPQPKETAPAQKSRSQIRLWQRALDTDDWLLDGAAQQN